jgi:hypothetical protein
VLTAISLLDPLGGAGQDIVSWLGHSISQGIGGFASWAIGGVTHAMQSTTTPDFTWWFAGPWRAMLSVVAWLSVPILFVGVGTAALRGDLTSVLRRGLGGPMIMAVGTAVALPVTAGLLTLVNACCGLLVNVALGGDQGFGQGLSRLSDFALSATVTTGGSGLPGLAAALIVAMAGLAALIIWFVLALRGALLYLEVLAIPLALCGFYWGGTAHWMKRLIDLIIATILSQLIITMLMVLAAADLNKGQLSGSNPGAAGGDMATLFLSLAFLVLGSLALPMALKHVPAATEHAAGAAAQISGPGRMTYMGSRIAGTARMMGRSGDGSQAIVRQAGATGGPVGIAASAGISAATMAGRAGVDAAVGANGGNPGAGVGPNTGASPASSEASASGALTTPHPGGSGNTGNDGPVATGGRGRGGGAAGQAGSRQQGGSSPPAGTSSGPPASGVPDGPNISSPGRAARTAAIRDAGTQSSPTREAPGESHGR